LAVLVASGLIVGESLFGVLLAGVIVATGNAAPFALVGDSFHRFAVPLAAIAFALTIWLLFTWAARLARRVPNAS
ncbi:MAG: oligopeptide transporter, OPT family, partial [Candidatus Eremiobacteraeota bacterium]|nr:oligopeptide transporter, OPT family [Candidatus Eremiobacteraeota bacterium]